MGICVAIDDIILINEHIRDFWANGGWAPQDASELLSKSRLDWQVSLSRMLENWIVEPAPEKADAHLILAWANLGALIEGSMKWFLCVHANDYFRGPVVRRKQPIDPDILTLGELETFFTEVVWVEVQRENWAPFVNLVRNRRNAVHAFQDRELGSLEEFLDCVQLYRRLLLELQGQVPYPTDCEGFSYPYAIWKMHEAEIRCEEEIGGLASSSDSAVWPEH